MALGLSKNTARAMIAPAVFVLIAVCFTFNRHVYDAGIYVRAAVYHGDAWRFISAMFVHLNTTHLVLNLIGLCLLWSFSYPYTGGVRLTTCTLFSGAAVTGMLYWLQPGVAWYAGYSGALHGLATYSLLSALRSARRLSSKANTPVMAIAVFGMLFLMAKLVVEAMGSGTAAMYTFPVLTLSHRYGAIGGIVFFILECAVSITAAIPIKFRNT